MVYSQVRSDDRLDGPPGDVYAIRTGEGRAQTFDRYKDPEIAAEESVPVY